MANLLFVVFFALKNTPLAFLTVWSYERLNCLHRIAGYTAVAHVLIHAGTYTKYFISEGRAYMLVRTSDIWGIVAGSCWIGLALAAVFLRRRWYELFYYIHVTLWAVSCVALAIHQPQIANKVAIGTIVAGSMWALDRIIRLVRITFRSVNNSATLTPLPNGGTRVTLAKTAPSVVSGKHCFLWIPGIRLFETHPFTIASANPLEFVIASHNGFTGDLHKYALAHAGVPLMASTDGPYGTVPNPSSFETIVLVAGGSGASYTFGLAQQLLGQMSNYTTKRVVFVWVVKDNCELSSLPGSQELEMLTSSKRTSSGLRTISSLLRTILDFLCKSSSRGRTEQSCSMQATTHHFRRRRMQWRRLSSLLTEAALRQHIRPALAHGSIWRKPAHHHLTMTRSSLKYRRDLHISTVFRSNMAVQTCRP